MKYISIENIDMKFTQMLWLIALQPQGWQVCILCNVIKNKILYVFRALTFTRYIQQLFEVSMAEIVTPVWRMGFKERGWERLTYRLSLHICRGLLSARSLNIQIRGPQSLSCNCRILVNNLCIFFSRQWNPQWHGFELCGSAYTQIFHQVHIKESQNPWLVELSLDFLQYLIQCQCYVNSCWHVVNSSFASWNLMKFFFFNPWLNLQMGNWQIRRADCTYYHTIGSWNHWA